MEELRAWAPILVSLATLIYAIASNRGKAASDRVTRLEAKAENSAQTVAKLEIEMSHLPDKDVSHRLELAIAGLKTDVATLGERIKPIAAMAERAQAIVLEEHHK